MGRRRLLLDSEVRQRLEDAELLRIPAELRQCALMLLMPNDVVLTRWRAGTLEELVSQLLHIGDAPDATSALQATDEDARSVTAASDALKTVDILSCSIPPETESVEYHDEQSTETSDLTDATSEYWWAYREDGQFGSHPQHDNYGDEGEP